MSPVEMRDGTRALDERLGRLIEFDEASRRYPARLLLERRDAADPGAIRSYRWRILFWLNQLSEGACVLFAHGHRAIARPLEQAPLTFDELIRLYHLAQLADEFAETHPGGGGGTSVLAGVKVMVEAGFFKGYHWCFTLEEALRTIAYVGPVVMGTWWKDSMFDTDASGHLDVSGRNAGGHAWVAYGLVARRADGRPAHTFAELDPDRSRVLCRNSWGPAWGKDGDFWLTVREFDLLRREQGEVCVPVERGGYFARAA